MCCLWGAQTQPSALPNEAITRTGPTRPHTRSSPVVPFTYSRFTARLSTSKRQDALVSGLLSTDGAAVYASDKAHRWMPVVWCWLW
jgi:hypothetical protein